MVPYRGAGEPTVTCTSMSGNKGNVKEQFWYDGKTKEHNHRWVVNTSNDWESKPVCTAEFEGLGRCSKTLDFILYSMY